MGRWDRWASQTRHKLVSDPLLPNSPLVEKVEFKQSGTVRMTTTSDHDNLNRRKSISSAASLGGGSFVVSSHAYHYREPPVTAFRG